MDISSPVLKKSKRLTSVVWNDFERVKRGDVCFAICIHCKKKLSGSSTSGTSHLRNHLKRCRKRSNLEIPPQLLLVKEKKKDGTVNVGNFKFDQDPNKVGTITLGNYKFDEPNKDGTMTLGNLKFDQEQKRDEIINFGNFMFDQDRSRLDLSRMIILHGYPLSMVEHIGFKVFVKNLQPLFKFITYNTVEADCMQIYEREKEKVSETLASLPGRISLTCDTRASSESGGYLRLTAHYIDQAWQLQKKVLNFVMFDPSHSGDVLSEVILSCLRDWAIDRKLFSMTLDDCFTEENLIFRLKERLSQNRLPLSKGRLFDVRCASHILNMIAQDALEALREVTQKIRESVRYVKSSQAMQVKFTELTQHVRVQSQKSLCLDIPMRWNSTYHMLEAALEYRDAFSLLQEHDSAYTMAPSDVEWGRANAISNCLKLFLEVTNVFSGIKFPTPNLYFPEICDIHLQMIEWCKSSDIFIASLALRMKEKFVKYWDTCSLALAVSAILDPRFKMKLVEYYYPQIYGTLSPDHIKYVSDGIKDLYREYTFCSIASLDQGLAWEERNGSGFNGGYSGSVNDTRDRLRGFDKFLHETSQSQHIKSDLDKYLEEPVYPRNIDFNILNWWKVHTPRFPILSMMARDVFGISMSTVELEPTFNSGSRVLDPYRSSLNPDVVQALVCTQNWLQSELEDSESSSNQSPLPLCMEAN